MNNYEILKYLPANGPMYVSMTPDGSFYASENGFIIRFFKKDSTSWVANFAPGWTDCNFIKYYPEKNIFFVISGGLGYVISPEIEYPLTTFSIDIKEILEADNNGFVASDGLRFWVINGDGEVFHTERISWDGFKNLNIKENILSGLSWQYGEFEDEWIEFSVNLINGEINGGSYRL